jgi:hypothetical protein
VSGGSNAAGAGGSTTGAATGSSQSGSGGNTGGAVSDDTDKDKSRMKK